MFLFVLYSQHWLLTLPGGHCQNLKSAYKKVAKSLKGIAKIAAIDCDDERNKPTCGKYGIQGFPTLKIFKSSGTKGKPQVEGT